MLIVTGVALVVLTWGATVLLLIAVGLLPAVVTRQGPVRLATLARAMWWGLTLMTLAVYAAALWWPLQSTGAAVLLLVLAALMTLAGVLAVRRRGMRLSLQRRTGLLPVAVAAAVSVVALAAAALGPITNIDSGLYHLGAIGYSAQFATIPGLSNLYGPLGYGTAEFPLAAVLGNGPWGSDGLRLLNGLIISMTVVDLLLRFTRRRVTVGRSIELVGAGALLVSMVALADYWVTSPTQDSAVFALTVVTVAFLADALTSRRSFSADASVAVVLASLMVLLRPTMIAFAAATLAVLVVRAWSWRREGETPGLSVAAALVTVTAVLAAGLAAARDYLLSGWLQYPLSIHAFDVPWRAEDPTPLREATLGYHRNPEDLWGSTTGWDWVGPWLSRAPTQWETWLFGLLAVAAVALLIDASRTTTVRWRLLALCIAPSAAATAAWWLLSPPSFRFAWGPVFTLAAIPCGWALWRLSASSARRARTWQRAAVAGFSAGVLVVTVLTLATRTEWSDMSETRQWTWGLSVPYAVAPVPEPPVESRVLPSGLGVVVPVEDELCWGVFPLCTPQVADSVRLAGATLQQGFLP